MDPVLMTCYALMAIFGCWIVYIAINKKFVQHRKPTDWAKETAKQVKTEVTKTGALLKGKLKPKKAD